MNIYFITEDNVENPTVVTIIAESEDTAIDLLDEYVDLQYCSHSYYILNVSDIHNEGVISSYDPIKLGKKVEKIVRTKKQLLNAAAKAGIKVHEKIAALLEDDND